LEREIEGIRREIQTLVGRVAPWEGLSSPTRELGEGTITVICTLMLGGLFIAGIASLVTGYAMQRNAIDRERCRQRALTMSIRRGQDQLVDGAPILPAVQPAALPQAAYGVLPSVGVLRRVRVSQKTWRRLRVRASSAMYEAAQDRIVERRRLLTRTPQGVPS